VEYKVIYRAYSHRELAGRSSIGRVRERYEEDDTKTMSEAQSVNEAKDWSDNLNASAKEGFTVKNSGTLQLFDNIVFWALLERPATLESR
jgi:hypothetical protein